MIPETRLAQPEPFEFDSESQAGFSPHSFTMLSRVAESIYWMARYVERAENIARFIDVNITFTLDAGDNDFGQWEPLIQITGDEEYYAEYYKKHDHLSVIQFLAFDPKYVNSLISSLNMARENARTVREAIPSEVWEQLNELYHFVRGTEASGTTLEGLAEFFQKVKQHSHLYSGLLDATMSRGDGWHFANMGRMIERADKTSRLLDVKYYTLLPKVSDVNTTIDDLQWSALLRSVSGFEMYRKRFHAITVQRVAEFLVRDPVFPRSCRFCLGQALESLRAIIENGQARETNSAIEKLTALKVHLDELDMRNTIDCGMHEFIDDFQLRLNDVGAAIFETYFDRAQLDLIPLVSEQSQ
ncbi:MAG: alpha-E domain-containing protein [Planctomycetaceae bacterium]|nr:alpha-E domain-containing protein [Planctomycetaceae bacterium]